MALRFFDERADEREVRARTAELVRTLVRPFAIEDDKLSRFRREVFEGCAQLGYHALSQPEEWGGGGRPHHLYYAFLEELARGAMGSAVSVSVTNLVQGAINAFGNAEQKDKYLRRLTSGEWLGAFSLSEPQSGSDAAALRTTARKVDGGYRITGTKSWCSNAGHANLYLLMARTGEHKAKGITAFLVPRETPGFRPGKQEKKLGLNADPLAELIFEEAFLPDSLRLGQEGEGFSVALSQLDAGRVSIGAIGIACAVECLERAWSHLSPEDEGVRQHFAEHFAQIYAVKALVYEASARKDRGEPITAVASSIKLLASDLAVRVAHDAVHYLGDKGVSREYEVERFLRDAKALQIVEGTNQVQRLVLTRELDNQFEG